MSRYTVLLYLNQLLYFAGIENSNLFLPQYPRTLPLGTTPRLLFVTFVKRHRGRMISPYIVQGLHFEDPDDPVLARECFFQRAQFRADGR